MLHDWYRVRPLIVHAVQEVGHHTMHCCVVQRITFERFTVRSYQRLALHDGELRAAAIRNQHSVTRIWFDGYVKDCVTGRSLNGAAVSL